MVDQGVATGKKEHFLVHPIQAVAGNMLMSRIVPPTNNAYSQKKKLVCHCLVVGFTYLVFLLFVFDLDNCVGFVQFIGCFLFLSFSFVFDESYLLPSVWFL